MFETIIRTPDYVDIDGAVADNNRINDGLFTNRDVTVAVRKRGEKLAICLTAEESTVSRLVIYPFVQKHFVKGAMIGAVKG